MRGSARRALIAGSVVWALSCSSSSDLKDDVPARVGAVMPDASGQSIGEAAACMLISDALKSVRSRLSCPSPKTEPQCPAYIRPAGGSPCVKYDRGTVDGCVAVIGGYKVCADFQTKPCIVVALAESDPACTPPPSDAGDAGQASDAEDSAADGAEDSSDATSDAAVDAATDRALPTDAPTG